MTKQPTEAMHRSERIRILGYEPPDESDWVTGLHPMDDLLRGERLPHIWCQGCGLGTALTTFIGALQWLEKNAAWDLDKVAVVSGIGCTGRIAGYNGEYDSEKSRVCACGEVIHHGVDGGNAGRSQR